MKKNKLIAYVMIFCLLALPLAVTSTTQSAMAEQKIIADFRGGKTVGAHNVASFSSRHFTKGDKIHVVATATTAFFIGVNSLADGSNYGVSCIGSCTKYFTIQKTGYYRVILSNRSASKGTVKGAVYLVK